MTDKIKELESKLDSLLIEESKDKITERNNWQPKKLKNLDKQRKKKAEYVLVQYLKNNRDMDFQLCKVISGNIIVIDNKGHKIDFRAVWRHGKYFWYIIHEDDTLPVLPRRQEKLRALQRTTENHPILMKMVLGAVQKKEELKAKMNIGWILGIGAVGLILWMIFGK